MMCSNIPKNLIKVCTNQDFNTNNLEIQLGAQLLQQIFIRSDMHLYQKTLSEFPSFSLSSLTICGCDVTFTGINFRCKIQVSGKSRIAATDCAFTPFDASVECAVEIFAGATGEFTNCRFYRGTKAAIALRDRSEADFTNCAFEESANTLLLVLDKSRANVRKCAFRSAGRFSLYLYRSSAARVEETSFAGPDGKGVFALSGCQAHLVRCGFDGCRGGGVSIADSSEAFVDRCSFSRLGSSAVHAMKNSVAQIKRCVMRECAGNGANFEFSTGYVCRSVFTDFDFPAIACFGPRATPVVFRSEIRNCRSFAVVSRDCARPRIARLSISGAKSSCFSISDFSDAAVEGCIVSGAASSFLSVFNGAAPTISDCIIQLDTPGLEGARGSPFSLVKAFTQGSAAFRRNRVCTYGSDDVDLKVEVKNKGQIRDEEFQSNYLYQVDRQAARRSLLSIGENSDVICEADAASEGDDVIEMIRKYEDESSVDEGAILDDQEPNVYIEEQGDQQAHANAHPFFFMQGPKRIPRVAKPEDLPEPLPELDVEECMKARLHRHEEGDKDKDHDHDEGHECDECCGHDHRRVEVCMRCKKNQAERVVAPCGHKVLCKECAEECRPKAAAPGARPEPARHFCPLCDLPIQGCTEEYPEELCSICLENSADTIILPCGHRCICYECATRLWTEKKQCPMCQARLSTFRYMFQIYSDSETKEESNENDDPSSSFFH